MFFSYLRKAFPVKEFFLMIPFFYNIIFYSIRRPNNFSYLFCFCGQVRIKSLFLSIKNSYVIFRDSCIPFAISFSYSLRRIFVQGIFFLSNCPKVFPRVVMPHGIYVINYFWLRMTHNDKGKPVSVIPLARDRNFYVSRSIVVSSYVSSFSSWGSRNFPSKDASFRAIRKNFIKKFFVHNSINYTAWSYK